MIFLTVFIHKLYDLGMKDNELAWFIKLAETQHVTWTADEMDLTQPTLSRAIARLEAEVGVPLFSRIGRRLVLNEFGKLFYESAKLAMTELELGKKRVAELASMSQHQIRIGTLHGIVPVLIHAIVDPFHSRSPSTTFYFRLGSPTEIINELELGHLDFILTTTMPDKKHLNWTEISKQVFYLAVGPEHKLASKHCAYLAEVAKDDFIAMRSGTAIRNLTIAMCRQAGFVPNIVLESSEIAPIRSLVAHGIGISIIPKSYTAREPENVAYLDISDKGVQNYRDMVVVWDPNGSRIPMLKPFLEFVYESTSEIKVPT